jgi:thiol peroxidase
MIDGPWKGLSARAVFVLDSENKVQYSELVPSIGQEPDYDSAMKAVESLLA